MRVVKEKDGGLVRRGVLIDDFGFPVETMTRFLGHLIDAGYSPHTVCAYGYDLHHLFEFLAGEGLDCRQFRPAPPWPSSGSCAANRAGDRRSGSGWRWPPARVGCWRQRQCSGYWPRRPAAMSGRSPPGVPRVG